MPGDVQATTTTRGAVRIRQVTKQYKHVTALNEVSLDIEAREFVAILGPSGSGKTTLLRLLGGFVEPSSGVIEISGVDVTGLPPNKRDVNTVFQHYALFPHMTVLDNVGYGLRMRGVRKRQRREQALGALKLVQLTHVASRRPHELSGGMQQRVALARALINRPSVLLLDEPLGALDRKMRDELQRELHRLHRTTDATFVYVTHDQDEALRLADRVIVMRDGRIVQAGTPQQIYDEPEELWTSEFVGGSNHLPGVVGSDSEGLVINGDGFAVHSSLVPSGLELGSRVIASVRPESLHVTLGPLSSGLPNCVEVEVEDVAILGAAVTVTGKSRSGLEISATVPRQLWEHGSNLAGKFVWMSWTPQAVRVFVDE